MCLKTKQFVLLAGYIELFFWGGGGIETPQNTKTTPNLHQTTQTTPNLPQTTAKHPYTICLTTLNCILNYMSHTGNNAMVRQ